MRTFVRLALVAVAIVFVAGCAGPREHIETAIAFGKFQRDHGIKVNLPYTWEAKSRPFDVVGDNERFRCPIDAMSPYPSKRSSKTELTICTRVVWDGDRYQWHPDEFDFERFAVAATKHIAYRNYLRLEPGELEPFSYRDNLGREWTGYRRTDVIGGINSITGAPYIEEAVHVFFQLGSSWGVWVVYREPISGVLVVQPYSHGLTPLDHIFVAGEQQAANP
ncbi:MAG: hypothetical protein MI741_18980 [Rhodospirillales bacterium]|nr:hypothetical protein [Rhodospirillales bacterium]